MTEISTPFGVVEIERLEVVKDASEDLLNGGIILHEEHGRKLMWGDPGFRAEMTDSKGFMIESFGFTEKSAVTNVLAEAAKAWVAMQPEIQA